MHIHVERAINRIKNFSILKGSLPLTLARMVNQIVCVCCWLVNFQPVLISPPVIHEGINADIESDIDTTVEEYFQSLYSSESDSDENANVEEC